MDLLRSLPLGLYLEQPITWLHRLDPRVKLAWLMTFLAAPLLANPTWRLALVALLIAITLSAMIPLRVWRQQMGWLLGLSVLVFALTCVLPDGLRVPSQPRLPSDELAVAPPPAAARSSPAPPYTPKSTRPTPTPRRGARPAQLATSSVPHTLYAPWH